MNFENENENFFCFAVSVFFFRKKILNFSSIVIFNVSNYVLSQKMFFFSFHFEKSSRNLKLCAVCFFFSFVLLIFFFKKFFFRKKFKIWFEFILKNFAMPVKNFCRLTNFLRTGKVYIANRTLTMKFIWNIIYPGSQKKKNRDKKKNFFFHRLWNFFLMIRIIFETFWKYFNFFSWTVGFQLTKTFFYLRLSLNSININLV